MNFYNVTLVATGLAAGMTTAIAYLDARRGKWALMLAWLGVADIAYILGRYVIYPASRIPYTAILAWYLAGLFAIVVGGAWALLSKRQRP